MSNLFPTSGEGEADYTDAAAGRAVDYGSTVQFDFEKHEFILSPTGKQKQFEGSDAWGEWCVKAMSTERYRYLVYDNQYGEELDTLIGKSRPHEVIESEIKRMTRECLMCDPRTAKVDDFHFRWIRDGIMFSCRLTNTLGETLTLTRTVVR